MLYTVSTLPTYLFIPSTSTGPGHTFLYGDFSRVMQQFCEMPFVILSEKWIQIVGVRVHRLIH